MIQWWELQLCSVYTLYKNPYGIYLSKLRSNDLDVEESLRFIRCLKFHLSIQAVEFSAPSVTYVFDRPIMFQTKQAIKFTSLLSSFGTLLFHINCRLPPKPPHQTHNGSSCMLLSSECWVNIILDVCCVHQHRKPTLQLGCTDVFSWGGEESKDPAV